MERAELRSSCLELDRERLPWEDWRSLNADEEATGADSAM